MVKGQHQKEHAEIPSKKNKKKKIIYGWINMVLIKVITHKDTSITKISD